MIEGMEASSLSLGSIAYSKINYPLQHYKMKLPKSINNNFIVDIYQASNHLFVIVIVQIITIMQYTVVYSNSF
jgi:hypothetical protein